MARTRRKLSKEEYTAYHEAGHAVMARILGRAFRRVSIVPDNESETLGRVLLRKWTKGVLQELEFLDPNSRRASERRTVHALEVDIMISMAGPIAERRVRGRHDWRKARGDLRSIAMLIDRMYCGKTAKAYDGFLWSRTEQLLTRPSDWAATKGLAKELLQRKQMGSRTATRIMVKAANEYMAKHTKAPPTVDGRPAVQVKQLDGTTKTIFLDEV